MEASRDRSRGYLNGPEREFILHRIDEVDVRIRDIVASLDKLARKAEVEMAMAAAERAINKAEMATEKRLELINEFRAQMSDQQQTFIRKAEVDIQFAALEKKIDLTIGQLQITKGREAGVQNVWLVIAGVATFMVSIAAVIVAFTKKG